MERYRINLEGDELIKLRGDYNSFNEAIEWAADIADGTEQYIGGPPAPPHGYVKSLRSIDVRGRCQLLGKTRADELTHYLSTLPGYRAEFIEITKLED